MACFCALARAAHPRRHAVPLAERRVDHRAAPQRLAVHTGSPTNPPRHNRAAAQCRGEAPRVLQARQQGWHARAPTP